MHGKSASTLFLRGFRVSCPYSFRSPCSVEKVELLDANPEYAFVRFPDGRESTVSVRDIAPYQTRKGDSYEVEIEDDDDNTNLLTDDISSQTDSPLVNDNNGIPSSHYKLHDAPIVEVNKDTLPINNPVIPEVENDIVRKSTRVRTKPTRLIEEI